MADNHFDLVLVWDNLGGAVRVNAGGRATVTDPVTGALVTVVQGGQSVTTVTADADGRVSFVAQQGIVKLTSGGLTTNAISAEQAAAGATNAAAAQDAQVAAESARDQAVTAKNDAVAATAGKVDKDTIVKRAQDHGVGTTGDQTANIQAFFTSLSAGDVALFDKGTYNFTSVQLGVDDVTVHLRQGAVLNKTDAATDGLLLTGARATVKGRGKITCPATFDASNTEWTYSVIRCTGADSTVRDITITNVPRVGVGFKNADGTSRVIDCTIVGNYPAASWDETSTVHFGVGFDPGTTSSKLIARGNTIKSCVQGIFLGNYGAGSSDGSIVQGNTFEGCHNHAIYGSASVTGVSVLGNTVRDCSRPVAMTGEGHDVSHNTFTTSLSSGNLAEVCGIQMRDAVDCTVSFNRMKGLVHASAPAIDLGRTGTNTTVTGNRVIGNKIEVTGANTAVCIRVGTGAETTLHGNIVAENNVKGPGFANQGLIGFFGTTGAQGYSSKCLDNVVTITGPAHGVYVSEMRGLDVVGNHVRLEYDAASSTAIGGVYMTANAAGTKVRGNDFECTASFGLNVIFRAIYEGASTVTASRYTHNRFSFDPTKLSSSATHIIQGTSGSILDEALPGAPTTVCGTGSRWMRTDGGASTTLYVKETAASSATWRAV